MIGLEDELRKIPGVRSVRVQGDDAPTEIHVVADPERPPKHVVRDVQTLAAATFGLTLDHRIVSVVQPATPAAPEPGERPARPVLQRVVVTNETTKTSVEVTLVWPDGDFTRGSASSGNSREARAHAAAMAAADALRKRLNGRGTIDIQTVVVQVVGSHESVLVGARLHNDGMHLDLAGATFVDDDVPTAAAKALLHAVNRKLK